jgi:hypothetical protein
VPPAASEVEPRVSEEAEPERGEDRAPEAVAEFAPGPAAEVETVSEPTPPREVASAGSVGGDWAYLSLDGGLPEGATLRGQADWRQEECGPHVFVPAGRATHENGGALRLGAGSYIEVDADAVGLGAGDGSLTLECYMKPDADPRADTYGVRKSRRNEGCSTLWAGAHFLTKWNQTYWSGGWCEPGGGPQIQGTGHYTTISRIHKGTLGWRHVAVVYDADARTVTVCLDHWQWQRRALDEPLKWDDGPIYIGGSPEGGGLTGLIDEVRVTKRALQPHEFLRASPMPLQDVGFASESRFPLDVRRVLNARSGFGAVGDSRADDTAALQEALRVTPAHHVLYLPAGTYRVSDTLSYRRFLTVWGDGPEKSVIKLDDRAPGFGDPKNAKPLMMCYHDTNATHSNYVRELALDTGKGNPGAIGFDYTSHNTGCVEDVHIRSGDGAGKIGLALLRKTPGPALIHRVKITGFDHGIEVRHGIFAMTFSDVRLENQNVAGFVNNSHPCAVERLVSVNNVPAIKNPGENWGLMVLVDANLTGGEPGASAIGGGGGLYARNVTVDGYARVLEGRDGTHLDEFSSEPNKDPRKRSFTSLKLQIKPTPHEALPPVDQWTSPEDFADRVRGEDWAGAIQAAIDSGKPVVYLRDNYQIGSTIKVRGPVKHIVGFGYGLKPLKGRPKDMPRWDFTGGRGQLVMTDTLGGPFVHRGAMTAVIQHTHATYEAKPGAGDLFVNDITGTPWILARGQRVWARQFNTEAHKFTCIENRGADLWVLGEKTEGSRTVVHTSNRGRTEILGGLIQPTYKVDPAMPMYILEQGSELSTMHFGVCFAGAFYEIFVQRPRGGNVPAGWGRHVFSSR